MDTAAARVLHDRAQSVAARLRLLAPGDNARLQLLLELADTVRGCTHVARNWGCADVARAQAARLRDAAAALSDASTRDVWTKVRALCVSLAHDAG